MFDGGLEVSLNGFCFYGEDENRCQWLVNSVNGGWNGAGTSHEHSARLLHDGWYANASRRLGRSITLAGSVWAPSQAALDSSRQRLLSLIPLEDGELIVNLDGVRRLWKVRQDSGEVLISRRGERIWDFSIPLVSLSPYSYDADGLLRGRTGLPAVSGGMCLPAAFIGMDGFGGDSLPSGVTSWMFGESVVSGQVSLVNPGEAPSPVVLRVDGPVKAPRIEHQPSGGVLALSGSLGAGHYVIFDSATRQVLVDGRDPARGMVVRRGWSDALPGQNVWRFTAKEPSSQAGLSVTFRGAYL